MEFFERNPRIAIAAACQGDSSGCVNGVYRCIRVRQFPACYRVLGTGLDHYTSHARLYFNHGSSETLCCVKAEGLEPGVAITSVTKSATAESGRAPSRCETFAPKVQGVCDFDCVSDRISLWIVYTDSSFVGGNSQGQEEIEPEKRYRKIASNEAKRT